MFFDEGKELWGQSKDGFTCELTLCLFSFFLAAFNSSSLQGPAVFVVFPVLIYQPMEGYTVNDQW